MGDPHCPPAACRTPFCTCYSPGVIPHPARHCHTHCSRKPQQLLPWPRPCVHGLRLTEEMPTARDAQRQLLGSTCTVLARELQGLPEEKERLKRMSMECVKSVHEHHKHTGVSSPCSYPMLNFINSTSKERIKRTAKSHF